MRHSPLWFPRPSAWLSAVALFVFSGVFAFGLTLVMPFLMDVMRYSPRLAFLGMLAVWLSPVPSIALGHRTVHAVLDVGDPKGRASPGDARLLGLWAGLYAWLVLLFTTTTTALLMLVLDPPPPHEPESVLSGLAQAFATTSNFTTPSIRMVVWIVVAAGLFHFEGVVRMRRGGTMGG